MGWSRTQLPICVFAHSVSFLLLTATLIERVEEIISIWMSLTEKPENVEGHVVELRPDVYSAWAAYGALWVPIPVHSGFTCSCNTSFEDGECSETSENFLPPPTLHGIQGFPGDGLWPGGTSSQFQKTQVVHVFWVTPLKSAQISRYDQRTTKKLILKTECTVCKLKTQVYFSGPLYFSNLPYFLEMYRILSEQKSAILWRRRQLFYGRIIPSKGLSIWLRGSFRNSDTILSKDKRTMIEEQKILLNISYTN